MLARWFSEPISSTLKMEAICSSKTSVETQRTTRRHIPEDDTSHQESTPGTCAVYFKTILQTATKQTLSGSLSASSNNVRMASECSWKSKDNSYDSRS
jgi:flagellar basal body rod protein FlgB